MFRLRLSNEESLKLINTLRSGTSPIHHADQLITGRNEELAEFRRCLELLDNDAGIVKIVTGDFGVGKSLLINAYKQMAINEDYVIASFQINNGFRLNKLEDLYYAVMHNLYLKDKPHTKASFDALFDLWVNNLQNAPHSDRKRYEVNTVCQELSKYNMNFARAFLSFMRGRIQRNQEMMNVSCAWLTGERNIPTELKHKYDLVGSVDKTNTLDFLRAFIKLITLLDYKGLIVFVDEIDLVLNDRSDIRQVAYSNLKHLVDLSTSGDMPNIMFVFSGSQDVLTDTEKGILSNIPLSQRLNLDVTKLAQKKIEGQNLLPLQPLKPDALIELTHKIIRIYMQIHDLPEPNDAHTVYAEVMKRLESQKIVTRQYVIQLIEHLDALKK